MTEERSPEDQALLDAHFADNRLRYSYGNAPVIRLFNCEVLLDILKGVQGTLRDEDSFDNLDGTEGEYEKTADGTHRITGLTYPRFGGILPPDWRDICWTFIAADGDILHWEYVFRLYEDPDTDDYKSYAIQFMTLRRDGKGGAGRIKLPVLDHGWVPCMEVMNEPPLTSSTVAQLEAAKYPWRWIGQYTRKPVLETDQSRVCRVETIKPPSKYPVWDAALKKAATPPKQ